MRKIKGKLKNVIRSIMLDNSHDIDIPKRLVIRKAKWFMDADSPVLLMIDDLANAWVEKNGKDVDGPEYDWGGKHLAGNSMVRFLHENLLEDYPLVNVVYFTVVGNMRSFNTTSDFASSQSIDSDEKASGFFRSIEFSDTGEIAYHGVQHGIPQEDSADYIQEWESFESLDQGLMRISEGKDIYNKVFGYDPKGGKYAGYKTNDISDSTIENSGFIWWCREWTPRDTTGRIPDEFYELEYFGEKRNVVSIPSTLHGKRWTKKQVDILLRQKQVISVQEHISPRRPDGRVQTPNIFDDIKYLRKLFEYLSDKNVWHTTGSGLASYFIAFTSSMVSDIKKDSFRIEYSGDIEEPLLTLHIDARCICSLDKPYIQIALPGGDILSDEHIFHDELEYNYMVNLPLSSGRFSVTSVEEPAKKNSRSKG